MVINTKIHKNKNKNRCWQCEHKFSRQKNAKTLLEESKYGPEKIKMEKLIDDDLEKSSSDESDSEADNNSNNEMKSDDEKDNDEFNE